jgi:hypothetical protein
MRVIKKLSTAKKEKSKWRLKKKNI